MPSQVGDVYVSLRLDSAAFERGVTIASQQSTRLGQMLANVARSSAAVADPLSGLTGTIQDSGEAAKTAGEHFEVNNRVMARFASIGVQEVIPSLQGSRLALENLLQPILRLSTGFGGLALGGIAVAGAIGYGVYRAFQDATVVWKDAQGNIMGVDERLKALDKTIGEHLVLVRGLRDIAAGAQAGDVLFGDPEGTATAIGALAGGAAALAQSKKIDKLLEQERLLKMARSLGEFSEAAGLSAQGVQNAKLMADNFTRLSVKVEELQRGLSHLAETDPLRKMLEADWEAVSALTLEIDRLIDRGELAADLGDKLRTSAYALGDQRRGVLTDTFNKQQGAGAAAALGLGDNNILAGLDAIEKLDRETKIYEGNIKRMVEAGVGQRDIDNEIQLAQTKVDATLAALNQRFADTPAVLDLLKTSLGKLEFGQFAKTLDATAKSLRPLNEGGITTFASGLDDTATAAEEASRSVVFLTGDINALARAVQAAALAQMLFNAEVGKTANLSAAPRAGSTFGGGSTFPSVQGGD